MDYPQLNLFFGLGLILMLVSAVCLRILLFQANPPAWMSWLSGAVLVVSILAALYIGVLFLRSMTPAFNLQIGLGLLLIGGIGALVTAAVPGKGSRLGRPASCSRHRWSPACSACSSPSVSTAAWCRRRYRHRRATKS